MRIRYLLAVIAAGVVLYLFWPLLGELRAAVALLRHVQWSWLVAAVVIQVLSYACLAGLNYFLVRPFPGSISYWRVLAILPAMAFIEVAVPSGGASGVVLRARLLGRSGYSVEASTFTLALETFYEVAVKALASFAGLWYLLNQGSLGLVELAYLAGIALAAGVALLLGRRLIRDRTRVERWALAAGRAWNRVARRWPQRQWAPETIGEHITQFYEGLRRLRQMPAWQPWLASTAHVALDVASLGACFAAFGYVLSPGVLLTGYGLTLLLSGLAALPGGLGLADASVAVIYARLNAPGAVALAAALTYRLIAFWLLRLIGLITWQALEAQHDWRTRRRRPDSAVP